MLSNNNNHDTPDAHIGGRQVLTVSEITRQIKGVLNSSFSNICVQGEISQFTCAASGHIYLTIKDEGAVLKGIIWRSTASRMPFDLEEGLEVIATGEIDVYPPRGAYQFIMREIHPCGLGSLQLAFKQLVEKLRKEGLFDSRHKKPLPPFPEKIGIITSGTGAAVRDMMRIIRRRWPLAALYILPRPVQGKGAGQKIAEAVELLNQQRPDLDLIILGRGGGSLEDLWPFNEECLARAIFKSQLPIVSAVGHEVDISVSDLVADLRAATPSEAGENTVPNKTDMETELLHLVKRLGQALFGQVESGKRKLDDMINRHVMRHPESLVQDKAQLADELLQKMDAGIKKNIDNNRQKTESLKGRLEALSPKKVLFRGYSITLGPDGKALTSAEKVQQGDIIDTFLKDGKLKSNVTGIDN